MRRYTITVGNKEYVIGVEAVLADHFRVQVEGQQLDVHLVACDDENRGPSRNIHPLVAPMPGTVVSIEVSAGDTVQSGQVLLILEAMKMKNALLAYQDGLVAEVLVHPGQRVDSGDVLLQFT